MRPSELSACLRGAHHRAGTPVVVIQGGKPCRHRLDALAGPHCRRHLRRRPGLRRGEVTVTHCAPPIMRPFRLGQAAGVDVARQDTTVTLARSPARPFARRANALRQRLAAFATDTAPPGCRRAADRRRPSEIYDHLFARRFACAEGFTALGARCCTAGRTLYMDGRAALHGAAVTAPTCAAGPPCCWLHWGRRRDPPAGPRPYSPRLCRSARRSAHPWGRLHHRKRHNFSTFLPKPGIPGPYWWILQ